MHHARQSVSEAPQGSSPDTLMASQSTPPAMHLPDEEDLGRPQILRFDDDFVHSSTPGKGKHKEASPPPSDDPADAVAYPPMSEDAEETRRIAENLKRWEIAERQRRKAARASTTSTASASLVTDVSRRASLLWTGKATRNASLGGFASTHTALQSTDNIDTLPLTDINVSPTPSPTHSIFDNTDLTDPFANPSEISPFADSQQYTPRSPSSFDPSSSALPANTAAASQTPPPPPRPLNLPPPRTPPPITSSPDPLFSVPDSMPEQDSKPVRWWHEWLCGCGEGPDRGGDNQAGRTNPFE